MELGIELGINLIHKPVTNFVMDYTISRKQIKSELKTVKSHSYIRENDKMCISWINEPNVRDDFKAPLSIFIYLLRLQINGFIIEDNEIPQRTDELIGTYLFSEQLLRQHNVEQANERKKIITFIFKKSQSYWQWENIYGCDDENTFRDLFSQFQIVEEKHISQKLKNIHEKLYTYRKKRIAIKQDIDELNDRELKKHYNMISKLSTNIAPYCLAFSPDETEQYLEERVNFYYKLLDTLENRITIKSIEKEQNFNQFNGNQMIKKGIEKEIGIEIEKEMEKGIEKGIEKQKQEEYFLKTKDKIDYFFIHTFCRNDRLKTRFYFKHFMSNIQEREKLIYYEYKMFIQKIIQEKFQDYIIHIQQRKQSYMDIEYHIDTLSKMEFKFDILVDLFILKHVYDEKLKVQFIPGSICNPLEIIKEEINKLTL